GSAAAVAAGMCPVALGTQTVGSVCRPAAFCGVPAIMPTQQRISRAGIWPLSPTLDHVGMFGRSVADLKTLLDVMSEITVEKPKPKERYRIGLVRDFFYDHATVEARSLNDALAGKLASANSGFEVEEVHLPGIFELQAETLQTIVRSEAASVHQ